MHYMIHPKTIVRTSLFWGIFVALQQGSLSTFIDMADTSDSINTQRVIHFTDLLVQKFL